MKKGSLKKAVLKSDPQPVPDRGPLTMSEFHVISYLRSTKNYDPSFRDMYNLIKQVIPRMQYFTYNEVKEMYNDKKKSSIFPFEDVKASIFNLGYQATLRKLIENPVLFLMNNGIPFFEPRNNRPWSDEEDELLIAITKHMNFEPDFPLLTACFPGRSGKAIYHEFLRLIDQKKIDLSEGIEPPNKYYSFIRRYFIPKCEKTLANQIKVLSRKGIQITEAKIRSMATQYYKSPWIVCERATFQSFIHDGKEIFKNDDEYSDDFMEMYNNLLSHFSNDFKNMTQEEKSENIKIADSMIEDFGLPKPKFSYPWIKAFLKRNRLSFRHAHFARRGKIDQTYVKIYINQVAHAAATYGWNHVYNVDETSVRINNGSTKTVAEVGAETVVVDKQRNEKECFTVIGCCTMLECKQLVIVSKGKTDKSKLKFQVGSNEPEILLSENSKGWTNEAVMLKYLDYFYESIAKKKDCALILDCLSAHRTPAVIQKANDLGIELIFVPANGTGYFQPLDRKVFGVLKSKLRSLAGSDAFSGSERYGIVTGHLLEAWESMKNNTLLLTSAWNIRGLFKLAEYKQEHFGEGDDDDFTIDATEEEEQIEYANEDEEEDNDDEDESDDEESETEKNEEDEDYDDKNE